MRVSVTALKMWKCPLSKQCKNKVKMEILYMTERI